MISKNRVWILATTLLGLLYVTRETTVKPLATLAGQYAGTRGLRNNNPGNLRWNGRDQWVGMTGQDKDGFIIFDTPENGIRALTRVLRNYAKSGYDTISEIINRWAPPSENDTASYIAHVAQVVGKSINEKIYAADYKSLVSAIIAHENFVNPYSDVTLNAGITAGLA